jgi:hypothetical protein
VYRISGLAHRGTEALCQALMSRLEDLQRVQQEQASPPEQSPDEVRRSLQW